MRRNQKPPNPKSTLISGIIFSVVLPPLFFLFIRNDIPFVFAPAMSAVCIVYFVYTYFREKKADIKAESEKGAFLDDSYLRSSEWHEKYLCYIQENHFENPGEHGMKSDLTSKYRQMASLPLTLIGLYIAVSDNSDCSFAVYHGVVCSDIYSAFFIGKEPAVIVRLLDIGNINIPAFIEFFYRNRKVFFRTKVNKEWTGEQK